MVALDAYEPSHPPLLCSVWRSAGGVDGAAKALWLPVNAQRNCPTTCQAAGLESVDAGNRAAALCARVTGYGAWFEG